MKNSSIFCYKSIDGAIYCSIIGGMMVVDLASTRRRKKRIRPKNVGWMK